MARKPLAPFLIPPVQRFERLLVIDQKRRGFAVSSSPALPSSERLRGWGKESPRAKDNSVMNPQIDSRINPEVPAIGLLEMLHGADKLMELSRLPGSVTRALFLGNWSFAQIPNGTVAAAHRLRHIDFLATMKRVPCLSEQVRWRCCGRYRCDPGFLVAGCQKLPGYRGRKRSRISNSGAPQR